MKLNRNKVYWAIVALATITGGYFLTQSNGVQDPPLRYENNKKPSRLSRSNESSENTVKRSEMRIDRGRKVEEEIRVSNIADSRITITNSGTLPSAVAKKLGLDESQTAAVQEEIGRFWKEMIVSTSSRARYDAGASDPAQQIDVYRIPALPDRGLSLKSGFLRKIADIVGDSRAEKLVNGIDQKPFGGFGKYDVKLTFMPDLESTKNDQIRVRYEYAEPTNGNMVFRGKSTLDSFSENFGPWMTPPK